MSKKQKTIFHLDNKNLINYTKNEIKEIQNLNYDLKNLIYCRILQIKNIEKKSF